MPIIGQIKTFSHAAEAAMLILMLSSHILSNGLMFTATLSLLGHALVYDNFNGIIMEKV